MPAPMKKRTFRKKVARPKWTSRKFKKRYPILKKVYPAYSSMPGLPTTKTIVMPYHMEMITNSAGISYNTFRSNSIYDPDYTGTGHQPRSHDQWAQYYKYYRVLSCYVKSIFFWEEIPSQSHAVGLYIDDNATFAFSSSLDLYEKSGPRFTKQLLSDRTSRILVQRRINLSKFANKALRDQRTAFGSNPTLDGPFIHVWTLPNNTTSLTYGGVRVHVVLHYKVQVFEPLDITGS